VSNAGYTGGHLQIDVVLSKGLSVLTETALLKPLCDLLHVLLQWGRSKLATDFDLYFLGLEVGANPRTI
jgi:hypothetical protein